MEVKVNITFLENDAFQIKLPGSQVKIYVDKAKENYSPLGPNPLELFLSSLAGCIGVYAKRYLVMHAVEFKELTIDIKAEFSQEHPARLVNIKAQVHTDADLGDKQEVFLRFIRNCPIHNTILHSKEIDIEIV
jgi:uncharacterized OsmC-like protein